MTDARLRELQQMQTCLKGLKEVEAVLKAAASNPLLDIRVTAQYVGNAYRSFEDMEANLLVSDYPDFEQAFTVFIERYYAMLQKRFDDA